MPGQAHDAAVLRSDPPRETPYWERPATNATIYDVENAHHSEDIAYWEHLIDVYAPQTVLELACGTGRLTIPLAVKGRSVRPDFEITGLDLSEAFLSAAGQKLMSLNGELSRHVTFVKGDMRDFAFAKRFDFIFIGFSSLIVLTELNDQVRCLEAVRRHLSEDGLFAIDLAMPSLKVLADAAWPTSAPVRLVQDNPVSSSDQSQQFIHYLAEQYYPHNQRVWRHSVREIVGLGESHRVVDSMWTHAFFPREVELLLRIAGLTPVERYGNYAGNAFDDSASQYLWIMRAA